MAIVIETERFLMRELKTTDANMFYSLNFDPEVTRYTGDTAFHSLSEAMDFLDDYNDYEKHGFGRWAVLSKEDSESWGWCGLHRREDGNVDMGYRLFQEKWGKGCATEVGRACVKYAFENLELPEIIAEAVEENAASFHVMERLGFKYWKDGEDHGYKTNIYKMTKDDYSKLEA